MRQAIRVRRPHLIPVRAFAILLALPVACSSGGGKSGAGGTTSSGGATGAGGAATGTGGIATGGGGSSATGTGGASVPTGLLNPDYTTTWNPGILADTQLDMALGADGLPVRTTVCASPKPGDDSTPRYRDVPRARW